MHKIYNEVERDFCIFTDEKDLLPLHSFERFPIYMGCTEEPLKSDIFGDMHWKISKTSGSVQLDPLVPLELLYARPHNDAIGSLWKDHHSRFSKFFCEFELRSILEIGGGTGLLAQTALEAKHDMRWTLIDPNPRTIIHPRLTTHKGYLHDYQNTGSFDSVIHSHVFEHAYNPREFLNNIKNLISLGEKMFFSIPDMKTGLEIYSTNMLNFEHTYLVREEHIEALLEQEGFDILAKENFRGHSIFYATEFVDPNRNIGQKRKDFPNLFNENYSLFKNFTEYYSTEISRLNEVIFTERNVGPVYLFGAHIFSQFLLANGLNVEHIEGILDNAPSKIGKRLYGTPFRVYSPKILQTASLPRVVLKAGLYNEEIKREILANIQPTTVFIE